MTPFCNSSFTHNPNRSVEADRSYKGFVQGKKYGLSRHGGVFIPKIRLTLPTISKEPICDSFLVSWALQILKPSMPIISWVETRLDRRISPMPKLPYKLLHLASHFISCPTFAIAFVNLPSVSRPAAENCPAIWCL